MSHAIRANGAVLLQSDVRTPGVPRTPAISDAIDAYFRDGWHKRDVRAERGVPLVLSGQPVVIDQDILSPEPCLQRVLHSEWVRVVGRCWFSGR